jgi:anthranilate phosphoribosyltransferase
MLDIRDAIGAVVSGRSLAVDDAAAAFTQIMEGNATPAQIAALIVALRIKGESVEEITGAARVMRAKATPVVPADSLYLVDTCGTGGDGSGTFNVSTAAALAAAGAGARVAKHGNRAVSSKSGSADVLEALGVSLAATPAVMKRCLDEAGICFLFAPALHAAMKYAVGPRKEIGLRTIFNVLGPLTNPAAAPAQLIGVFSPELTEPLAGVLRNLDTTRAFVVHGMDGLDEVSLSRQTRVSELDHDVIRTYEVRPEDFGLQAAPLEAVRGGDAEHNAGIIRDVLEGKPGPYRDIAVLNAAFAIAAAGLAATPRDGVPLAQQSIDSGAAQEKLQRLSELSCTT